jgi:sulfate transport system permease protein
VPKVALRIAALAYLGAILIAPVSLIFYRTFEHGLRPVWESLSSSDTLHALKLTLIITAIAVPANTIFGIALALAIVRKRFPGKGLVNALVDLPLALSPVVVGLSLLLLYGRDGWIHLPFRIVFALPGMVLATIFVSLPFVVREVVPVLREIGEEQEQAGQTLGASSAQIFLRITLPAIQWGVAYGVVLTTARCLGEFGAVTVVSGRIVGQTETLTTHVSQAYDNFDVVGAYSASLVLALIAISTLVIMNVIKPKEPTQ